MSNENPDVKKFIEDPKFAGDRALFDGYLEHVLTQRAAQVKERREKKTAPVGIFDTLFGWFGQQTPNDNEEVNAFDSLFGGRRK